MGLTPRPPVAARQPSQASGIRQSIKTAGFKTKRMSRSRPARLLTVVPRPLTPASRYPLPPGEGLFSTAPASLSRHFSLSRWERVGMRRVSSVPLQQALSPPSSLAFHSPPHPRFAPPSPAGRGFVLVPLRRPCPAIFSLSRRERVGVRVAARSLKFCKTVARTTSSGPCRRRGSATSSA